MSLDDKKLSPGLSPGGKVGDTVWRRTAHMTGIKAVLTPEELKLCCDRIDSYTTPASCGHMLNFQIGDEYSYGNLSCLVCQREHLRHALEVAAATINELERSLDIAKRSEGRKW